ncbi:MAG TPA: c-type cytochrome [Holophagaceae bacterium]|nr:c-type cytochrome [Holophagaceae bacterium]
MRPMLLAAATLTLPLFSQAPVREAAALRAFFVGECARCHGEDGSAVAPDGKRLKGQDFTNRKEMAEKQDAKLAKTILKGIFFGKAMPAFKDRLSEAEALAMVTEVVRKAEKGKAIRP